MSYYLLLKGYTGSVVVGDTIEKLGKDQQDESESENAWGLDWVNIFLNTLNNQLDSNPKMYKPTQYKYENGV